MNYFDKQFNELSISKDDERYDMWKKQYEQTGIIPFHTWNLDASLVKIIKSHIIAYMKDAEDVIEIDEESILDYNLMIKLCDSYLEEENLGHDTILKQLFPILQKRLHRMWW